jgi:hypothetical protein
LLAGAGAPRNVQATGAAGRVSRPAARPAGPSRAGATAGRALPALLPGGCRWRQRPSPGAGARTSPPGACEEGEEFADGRFPGAGPGHRQAGLDLVAVAPACVTNAERSLM